MKKETSIAFPSEMVTSILEGKKTQFRRPFPMAPLQVGDGPNGEENWPYDIPEDWKEDRPPNPMMDTKPMECPYGAVGDILWVKERWRKRLVGITFEAPSSSGKESIFKGDPEVWKPAESLPKGLSRISLQITAVRAERLQQITEEDAIAEGAEPFALIVNKPGQPGYPKTFSDHDPEPHRRNFLNWFDDQWFGAHYAKDNPWVWVITFRRLKP